MKDGPALRPAKRQALGPRSSDAAGMTAAEALSAYELPSWKLNQQRTPAVLDREQPVDATANAAHHGVSLGEKPAQAVSGLSQAVAPGRAVQLPAACAEPQPAAPVQETPARSGVAAMPMVGTTASKSRLSRFEQLKLLAAEPEDDGDYLRQHPQASFALDAPGPPAVLEQYAQADANASSFAPAFALVYDAGAASVDTTGLLKLAAGEEPAQKESASVLPVPVAQEIATELPVAAVREPKVDHMAVDAAAAGVPMGKVRAAAAAVQAAQAAAEAARVAVLPVPGAIPLKVLQPSAKRLEQAAPTEAGVVDWAPAVSALPAAPLMSQAALARAALAATRAAASALPSKSAVVLDRKEPAPLWAVARDAKGQRVWARQRESPGKVSSEPNKLKPISLTVEIDPKPPAAAALEAVPEQADLPVEDSPGAGLEAQAAMQAAEPEPSSPVAAEELLDALPRKLSFGTLEKPSVAPDCVMSPEPVTRDSVDGPACDEETSPGAGLSLTGPSLQSGFLSATHCIFSPSFREEGAAAAAALVSPTEVGDLVDDGTSQRAVLTYMLPLWLTLPPGPWMQVMTHHAVW